MADRMVETGTAIVTGGAGGIGKATVRRLLDMGLSVFIVDADEKSLDTVLSEFGAASGRLDGCRADVMDEQQVTKAVDRAVARFGDIYALVHVAGGAGPKRARDIEDFQLREWAHVMDLNLTSAFLAARAVVPLMRKRRARTDRGVFLDHRRWRERAADDGDRATALRDGEGGAARLHRAARQGPGGVRHHR